MEGEGQLADAREEGGLVPEIFVKKRGLVPGPLESYITCDKTDTALHAQ